jgi:cytochrome bd ubiquinol oxidase subunit I
LSQGWVPWLVVSTLRASNDTPNARHAGPRDQTRRSGALDTDDIARALLYRVAVTDLLAARAQMALSLAFHIVFAVVGMAMPLLMLVAESRWLRDRNPIDLELAKRWTKGTAIMFAVGAVSGTVLSFELGLLWPEFMRLAGPIIGMPFSLEGFAFFLEAIFLGIYLYGWERVPPRAHLFAGFMVLLSGTASGVFVVCANGWMNTPVGFDLDAAGKVIAIDPVAAMLNPAALPEALHMTIAAFEAVGFAVAGIHAFALLKDPGNQLHTRALAIALLVGGAAALVQPLSGHQSAVHVATHQPVKLAAMEAHWDTSKGVGAVLGGWPDEEAETTSYKLEVPYLMSLLAFNDPDAEIRGLKEWPRDERPPVAVVHVAFQLMVGAGTALAALTLLVLLLWWRKKAVPTEPRLLKLIVLASPLGMIAVQAGWTVTEVGRQPWVIRGILRTADAVTPMPHLAVPFTAFMLLYVILGVVAAALLKRHVFATITPDSPGWPGNGGAHSGGRHNDGRDDDG